MVGKLPYDPAKVAALREKHDHGQVVGLLEVAGVVERKDIEVLLNDDPKCFNLFLLAFLDLQYDPKFTKASMGYMEIAGIHGLPLREWHGVKHFRKTPDRKSGPYGYCEHSSFKFPSWHRPYLAMLEQSLYLRMITIAETFPDPATHLDAVQGFRLPFWDYFRPRDYGTSFPGIMAADNTLTYFPYDFGVPQLFTLERLNVTVPNEGQLVVKSVANPLRNFGFPADNRLKAEEWALIDIAKARFARGHTVRHGLRYFKNLRDDSEDPRHWLDIQNGLHANRFIRAARQGNEEELHFTVNQARASALREIRNMLYNSGGRRAGYNSYRNFATNLAPRDPRPELGPQPSGSIEDFHNNWHGNIGGMVGHMGSVPVAAFDPIFFFHHCNIDRYIATWQEINPGKWFEEDPTISKEALKPFLTSEPGNNEGFWTSKMTENTNTFGYAYPDIVKGDGPKTLANFERLEAWSLEERFRPVAPSERTPLDLSSKDALLNNEEYLPPLVPIPPKVQQATTFKVANRVAQRVADTSQKLINSIARIASKDAEAAPEIEFSESQAQSGRDGLTQNDQADNKTAFNSSGFTKEGEEPAPVEVIFASTGFFETNVDEGTQTDFDDTDQLEAVVSEDTSQSYIGENEVTVQSTIASNYEWYIDSEINRLALNGPFGIYYYIGLDGNPLKYRGAQYITAPTLAGMSYNFVAPVKACENCADQAVSGVKVTSTTNITALLRDYVKLSILSSLDPENVKPFLQERLKWAVLTIDAEKTDVRKLSQDHGLKLLVNSTRYVGEGEAEELQIGQYPEIVETIIAGASAQMTP